MSPKPLLICLRWENPATGERHELLLSVPVALGRDFKSMPTGTNGRRVSQLVLNSSEVSRFHALIDEDRGGFAIVDQNSSNGTFVNGQRQTRITISNGDVLQIGPYQISVALAASGTTNGAVTIGILQQTNSKTGETPIPQELLEKSTEISNIEEDANNSAISASSTSFPPSVFEAQQVSIQDLHATGLPVDEADYVAVGAGLGSFTWIDLLRIHGVKTSQIVALGLYDKPYGHYQKLCRNSQIFPHERLRSNSDSCPDNIWGWPSYALREAWRELIKGQIRTGLGLLWQVFAEPTFAQTYTPRSGNVFAALDREAKRIGWEQMYRYGRVRAIRKTDDGRYAIAYSRSTPNQRNHAIIIARYVHIAIGYPAIQFLPDLQAYREKTGDFKSVVHAYEYHDHIYEHLEAYGGTVLIRGRGIVSSRILQRLYEARQKNPHILILHLMRFPKPQGNKFGWSQRKVINHNEFQPFNWPKGCWTGEQRVLLEKASPEERIRLTTDWGGTTTAERKDWKRIIDEGLSEGWYKIEFGEVEKVEREPNGLVTYIQAKQFKGQTRLETDFIIDSTGLTASVFESPLLKDMVEHYNLPLNPWKRFLVANDFEIVDMQNPAPEPPKKRFVLFRPRRKVGRMYAAGVITLGGPNAAVDSFLGLQYVALAAVDSLAAKRGSGLRRLNIITSWGQWLKWAINRVP